MQREYLRVTGGLNLDPGFTEPANFYSALSVYNGAVYGDQ